MDRYDAYQIVIRISHLDKYTLNTLAREIATVSAARLGVDGFTLTYTDGYWKGVRENGAVIEIVVKDVPINEDITRIRGHVTAVGLTAFVTVARVTAFELY